MSIRKFNKDHLNANFNLPASGTSPELDYTSLSFWTLHKKPIFVDLNVFREGEATKKGHGRWNGPFTGRPTLIEQLFPAIKGISEYASPQTISRLIATLRYWWRLFDELEEQSDLTKVAAVADIGEMHRQFAIDQNIDCNHFRKLLQITNLTRLSLGLRRLYWNSPEPSKPIRNIATRWHFDQIRFLLKHQWYATIDRWQRADELMNGDTPTTKDEQRLQAGYLLLQSAIANSGQAKPDRHAIRGSISYSEFNDRGRGHVVDELFRGFYPNGDDVRNAFHLCLATTGWNAAVLISIDANEEFIEPHPKDSARYLMRGFKERGKSEPIAEGLFKSQGSAGFVMKTIISRTAPLREELRQQLEQLRKSIENSSPQNLSTQDLKALRQKINQLEEGVRSPWLYVTGVSKGILWLDNFNFSKGGSKVSSSTFLDRCIGLANASRSPEKLITRIKPGDLRDAFGEHAYRVSGGCILFVMRALSHRSPNTTMRYIDNNIINAESKRIYRAFSNSLWNEIKLYKRCDPTLIAKWSQDGNVSILDRERLDEYRTLRAQRSRIGVACRDPKNPPPHIAPTFKPDGKAMCPVQRCMLCLEHAIILPESLEGLCKRLAELEFLHRKMSTVSYLESSFPLELENTRIALTAFDSNEVAKYVDIWSREISNGTHFVPT